MMRVAPRVELSVLGQADDPYPIYEELRAAGPMCRGNGGMVVVPRYREVATLLRDPRAASLLPDTYFAQTTGEGPTAEFLRRIVLHRDPPEHRVIRRVLAQRFGGDAVRSLRSRIATIVDDLLSHALDAGEMEAVAEIAVPLPIMVMSDVLGIPECDLPRLHPLMIDLAKAFLPIVPALDRIVADEVVVMLRQYLAALLDTRARRSPASSVLQGIGDAVRARQLDLATAVDNLLFLFFAGYETTTSMIGTGVAALVEHQTQLGALRANPGLAPAAVEEALRFDAPIQARVRHVREEIDVAGRTVRPGRLLLLLVGSANRDERQFRDPTRFDIARRPNPHLSFGGGEHYCLGAALGRLEGAVVFQRMAERFSTIEAGGANVRRSGSAFRSYARVPLTLRAA